MSALNTPHRADRTAEQLEPFVEALLDGSPRIIYAGGRSFLGYVWEIYRSIETPSVRIRCSDSRGYVYHFNLKRDQVRMES